MKNQLFILAIALCLMACNGATEESTALKGGQSSDLPAIEKTYTGKLMNRFEQAIQNMEKEDAQRTAMDNEVLFTGSSSIRMWSTLPLDFDPIPVINRGFGGSTLPEVTYYAERMIVPYQPKLLVLYCGENDISEGASPEQTFEAFKKLDGVISKKLPQTKMIYIAMKPSVARWNLWEKYRAADKMIQDYIDSKPNRYFIDCSPTMLTASGQPDSTIFVEDMLHMNAKGYDGWEAQIEPLVQKLYDKKNDE